MTIWDLLLPWRNIPALKHARKTIKGLKRERNEAITSFTASILHGDAIHQGWLLQARDNAIAGKPVPAPRGSTEKDKRILALETELLQTKRAGYADLARDLGVSVEEIVKDGIQPLLHDDPQAVYRSLDNAQASEVKFRQVRRVNLELRLVIRNLIDTMIEYQEGGRIDTTALMADLTEAERYATPLVMEDKRKVLGSKRKKLRLNYPARDARGRRTDMKGEDDAAQAQADNDQAATAKGAASTEAEAGSGETEETYTEMSEDRGDAR